MTDTIIAAIITGIFGLVGIIIAYFFGWKSKNKLKLGANKRDFVEIIHSNEKLDDIQKQVRDAKEILAMYGTGSIFLKMRALDLEHAILQNKCHVKILIADEANNIFKYEEFQDSLAPKIDMVKEIEESREFVKEIIQRLSPHKDKGSITLKTHSFVPTGSTLIIDNIVRYTPYLPNANSAESVSFIGDITSQPQLLRLKEMFNKNWELITLSDVSSLSV